MSNAGWYLWNGSSHWTQLRFGNRSTLDLRKMLNSTRNATLCVLTSRWASPHSQTWKRRPSLCDAGLTNVNLIFHWKQLLPYQLILPVLQQRCEPDDFLQPPVRMEAMTNVTGWFLSAFAPQQLLMNESSARFIISLPISDTPTHTHINKKKATLLYYLTFTFVQSIGNI